MIKYRCSLPERMFENSYRMSREALEGACCQFHIMEDGASGNLNCFNCAYAYGRTEDEPEFVRSDKICLK